MSPALVRASLLGQLDAITSPQRPWNYSAGRPRSYSAQRPVESRWHRHLLRLMGDALAWKQKVIC